MTGLVLLSDPPTTEHLRLRCELASCGAEQLLFWDRRGLGNIRLVDPDEFATRYGLEKLGPEREITDGGCTQISHRLLNC